MNGNNRVVGMGLPQADAALRSHSARREVV